MTLRDLYIKPDQWLIEKTQDAYLRLLDRTGVYIATIEMAIYLGSAAYLVWRYGSLSWVLWVLLLAVSLILMARYHWQDKRQYEIINSAAIAWEGSIVRHLLFGFQFGFLIRDFIVMDLLGVISTMALITMIYLQAVKLRDRDKKPMFQNVLQPSPQKT